MPIAVRVNASGVAGGLWQATPARANCLHTNFTAGQCVSPTRKHTWAMDFKSMSPPPTFKMSRSYNTSTAELMNRRWPPLAEMRMLLPEYGPVQNTSLSPVPTMFTSRSTVIRMSELAF